jgi:hypothetical protein
MVKKLPFVSNMIAIVILFSTSISTLHAQHADPPARLLSFSKFELGLQGVGFSYEPAIAKKITIDLSAGIAGGYDIAEGSLYYDMVKPAVYVSATPKYFYNVDRRVRKGKNTTLNSSNYLGLRIKYNNAIRRKDDLIRNSILTNIHWGMQRAMGNHWLFNWHVGAGYAEDVEYHFGTIYPSLDFKFSYIFQRSQK